MLCLACHSIQSRLSKMRLRNLICSITLQQKTKLYCVLMGKYFQLMEAYCNTVSHTLRILLVLLLEILSWQQLLHISVTYMYCELYKINRVAGVKEENVIPSAFCTFFFKTYSGLLGQFEIIVWETQKWLSAFVDIPDEFNFPPNVLDQK